MDLHEANAFGEALRQYCFVPDEYGGTYGCYETFKLRSEFKPVTNAKDFNLMLEILGNVDGDPIDCFTNGTVIVAWHWDGDGTLVFKEGDKVAVNTDCKKDYVWEWYE